MNSAPPAASAVPASFKSFSVPDNKYINATSEFFKSESLVAKVAFLLLAFFGFILALRVGAIILAKILKADDNPKLIDGMVDAKNLKVISQNPNTDGSITIPRSDNEEGGIEMTWSVWIYIDNLTYNANQYKTVFYKGTPTPTDTAKEEAGINETGNAPGLYIAPNTNKLVIFMNTFETINERVEISDIPLNKFINVIIRIENQTLDVYINGTITKSHQLHGVPKQNYGNVYVAANGGFDGYISNLFYYNKALSPVEVEDIVQEGPNTEMVDGDTRMSLNNYDFLNLRWYMTPN